MKAEFSNEEEIAHFGIPGMKWGVRRSRSHGGSTEYKRVKQIRKKPIKDMTNKQLKEVNTRMTLENNYRNNKYNDVSQVHKKVRQVAVDMVLTGLAAQGLNNAIKKYGPAGANYLRQRFGR